MKLILTILLLLTLKCGYTKTIYDYSFVNEYGNTKSLNDFKGTKIVIVILPGIQSESNQKFLVHLDSISKQYSGKAVFIGIPSYEYGFSDQNSNQLFQWYRTYLNQGFYLSKAVFTNKTSQNQNELFTYLTNKDLNIHFDYDISGDGEMFYIDSNGELFGLFPPETKMSLSIPSKFLL